jgi:hypothetical protein
MSEENIQTDTPQQNTNEQQYQSLEEAVFGTEGSEANISEAFTTGEESAPTAPQGQPVENTQEGQAEETVSNDTKRYQYWQSQADKLQNELTEVKKQQNQQVVQQQQVQQEPQQTEQQSFPPPPPKPERPRSFNREEGYNDPSSESARYLDDVESWRDDMNEYNSLKSEYSAAIVQEKFQNMENERVQAAQRFQAEQQKTAKINQVKEHVMGHYGMDNAQADDFMTKMSNPKSLTIDNLVRLYRLQSNQTQGQQAEAPSDSFTQTQNAQQIPSPMGVMPGESSNDARSAEDKIMDTMIGNFNSKNPWK